MRRRLIQARDPSSTKLSFYIGSSRYGASIGITVRNVLRQWSVVIIYFESSPCIQLTSSLAPLVTQLQVQVDTVEQLLQRPDLPGLPSRTNKLNLERRVHGRRSNTLAVFLLPHWSSSVGELSQSTSPSFGPSASALRGAPNSRNVLSNEYFPIEICGITPEHPNQHQVAFFNNGEASLLAMQSHG
jgi:hypothetical protein